jgi:HK97 family phage major capsid protein
MQDAVELLNELSNNIENFKTKNQNEVKSLKAQMEELTEDVNRVKDQPGRSFNSKTLGKMAIEQMREAGISSKLEKGSHRSFVIKEAGNFLTSNVTGVGTNSIPYSLSDAEPGLTRIVKRRPWIMELANVSRTNKMWAQWSEQENPDGNAGPTSEGSTKNQIDFDWVEKSKKVEKFTAFIKPSKESLDDLDGLRNDIDTELREEIMLVVDAQLLDGDGTPGNLDGVINQATTYSAGSFAGMIEEANEADVIRTAISQVAENQFQANAVLMHPADVAKLDLLKSTSDKHYLNPSFAGQRMIAGVPVYENTGMTQGDFLVGDFTKLNIKMREDFMIDVGYDGNDFSKNLVTVLGEIRLVSYVKGVHTGAFVSGDFATAINELESGS